MSYWCGWPISPGGHGVCRRTSASSLFSRITIMSTRRSSSRSMMRSLTPWRPLSGLRGSADLLPVLEGGALIVAPEFRARVERRPIGERLGEAARLPVRRAPHQVLRDVEAERVRQLLLLDGGEVEVRRRRDAPLRHRDAIVDRLHRAGAEDLARQELGRHDRGGELLEDRLPVAPEPEQQVGHEDRHEPAPARGGNPSSSSRCPGPASTADRWIPPASRRDGRRAWS